MKMFSKNFCYFEIKNNSIHKYNYYDKDQIMLKDIQSYKGKSSIKNFNNTFLLLLLLFT